MTEDNAQAWILDRYGDSGYERMEKIVRLVTTEAKFQNLIAPSTFLSIWNRHILDSAQLLEWNISGTSHEPWIDIGSGAGFPGLVIAALVEREIWLVEPRKKRAEFLEQAVRHLGLSRHAKVFYGRIETLKQSAAIISARAVAKLVDIFDWASVCATTDTYWILPKGKGALEEVAIAERTWHGTFHVKRSVTNLESRIILASGVKRR